MLEALGGIEDGESLVAWPTPKRSTRRTRRRGPPGDSRGARAPRGPRIEDQQSGCGGASSSACPRTAQTLALAATWL